MSDVLNNMNINETTTSETSETNNSISKDELIKIINAAVSSHIKRFESKWQKHLEELKSTSTETHPSPDSAQENKVEPTVLKLQKQLEKLQNELREKEKIMKEKERIAREKDAYGQLLNHLKGKVVPGTEDTVAKLLFHAEKRITVHEDGQITYKDDNGTDILLEDGLQHYLSQESAKIFKPAPTPTVKKPIIPEINKPIVPNLSNPGNQNKEPSRAEVEQYLAYIERLQNLGM